MNGKLWIEGHAHNFHALVTTVKKRSGLSHWHSSSEEMALKRQLKALIDKKIAGKKVVVFSKTTRGFCSRAKSILEEYNLSPAEIEIMDD